MRLPCRSAIIFIHAHAQRDVRKLVVYLGIFSHRFKAKILLSISSYSSIRGVVRIAITGDASGGIHRRSPPDSSKLIVTHLLRTHRPDVRTTAEARSIVDGAICEPNIVVRAFKESSRASGVCVREEVRMQNGIVWRFCPGSWIEEIGSARSCCDQCVVGYRERHISK